MNNLAFYWREDKYWKDKNYAGTGICSNLYNIYDLCKMAFEENKNLYVSVEKI